MKTPSSPRERGFTLLETVIAIGVLAVLLTGFMLVFAPAAAGIRKAINVQDADRLASTLELELVKLRPPEDTEKTGFDKAFEWVKNSAAGSADDALLIYKYRGSLSNPRTDGTPTPVPKASENRPGVEYVTHTMMRRKGDPKFLTEDLPAIEGGVYLVKCTQLIFKNGELTVGTEGQIVDPKTPAGDLAEPDLYPEAVIAFSAEFHALPAKSAGYFNTRFAETFGKLKNPVFTRNLAVRR